MKMNVSTQTLLSEEVIQLLLKNYIVSSKENKAQNAMMEYLSMENTLLNVLPTKLKKDYISSFPIEVIIKIAKYLTVSQFFTFSSTCKRLYSNFQCSHIWNNYLKMDYSKILHTLPKNSDLYDKYRELATSSLLPKECTIANMGRSWCLDKEGSAVLMDVCWFEITGEFNYITNGEYIMQCEVKVENMADGLVGLDFIAKCQGSEPSVFTMSRICFNNIRGKGWTKISNPKLVINNPDLYSKVKIQIVNKKCHWKYGFSIRLITLKKIH